MLVKLVSFRQEMELSRADQEVKNIGSLGSYRSFEVKALVLLKKIPQTTKKIVRSKTTTALNPMRLLN